MGKIELLAPVGNVETFQAALAGGADAVYVGAPGFNARNPARELQLHEIGAMIRHCHDRRKKFYIAANSLVLESELGSVVETLALFQELDPDGLIVQDLGVARLVINHFPTLKLHGSTLMTVHNLDGVLFLSEHGFERVVLARELTLGEITAIAKSCGGTELEIFIHGAMCFSYSGLCLFSSYLGGKSGLRGRCVQPCRRGYRGEDRRRPRYLFSMNDLNGLDAVPALKAAGISSLKVEGRLRSAHYVRTVMEAYRLVLDASPDVESDVLAEAKRVVGGAMSRKTSSGYFFSAQPDKAIIPYHSGNMGIHLGRFSVVRTVAGQQVCRFVLKGDLAVADRLRLHVEPCGERISFRLKKLFVSGEEKNNCPVGSKASITLPESFHIDKGSHVEVYKVDGAAGSGSAGKLSLQTDAAGRELLACRRRLASSVADIVNYVTVAGNDGVAGYNRSVGPRKIPRKTIPRKKIPIEWWLKTDSVKSVIGELPFYPDRYLLTINRSTLADAGKIKARLAKRSRMVTWVLPPVIMPNVISRYSRQVHRLQRIGFRSFQIGHISQVKLFTDRKVHLIGGYTVNVTNNQALRFVYEQGLEACQASIELDREGLRNLIIGSRGSAGRTGKFAVGLTVYGAPALYTSRLAASHFQYDKRIYSPKKEPYLVRKNDEFTQTFPEQPFSLLPYLNDMKELGLGYVVVDLCGVKVSKRILHELRERLYNSGKYGKLSTFNYLGKLQ